MKIHGIHAAPGSSYHKIRAAIRKGETKYEGRPCKEGHTQRYVSNHLCVACQSARGKKR